MRLILFRHGPAGQRDPARWPDDAKRPVTRRGRERTVRAAAGLRRLIGAANRVVTSPLVRARQTAELVGEAVAPQVRVETLDALLPGAPTRETLRWLRGLDSGAKVILVGHEPHLGKVAGILLFDSVAAQMPLKKAGALMIDFVGPVEAGAGRLVAFLPPRALRGLARHKNGA
jgi:phosphohistidine phosphatase